MITEIITTDHLRMIIAVLSWTCVASMFCAVAGIKKNEEPMSGKIFAISIKSALLYFITTIAIYYTINLSTEDKIPENAISMLAIFSTPTTFLSLLLSAIIALFGQEANKESKEEN